MFVRTEFYCDSLPCHWLHDTLYIFVSFLPFLFPSRFERRFNCDEAACEKVPERERETKRWQSCVPVDLNSGRGVTFYRARNKDIKSFVRHMVIPETKWEEKSVHGGGWRQ